METDTEFVSKNLPLPSLSVVVCTRNRIESLRRCVKALLSVKTNRVWELVIVDNGSTDGTSEYLESIDHTLSDRVHLTTVSQPRPGLAAARNMGWPNAKADIIAFTDDDCYVSEDYVDSIIQVFEDSPTEVGFVSGRILLFDPIDYAITIQESQHARFFRPNTFIAAGAVQGANMAFRRTALEKIGGFDERLGPGTKFNCEDINAAAAVLWSGIPGIYDPRPLVYHHHGRKESEAGELMRSYDAGRGAYYAKYILRKDSRSEYLRAWTRSISDECRGKLRRGLFPTTSLRELFSGLHYALTASRTPSATPSTSRHAPILG